MNNKVVRVERSPAYLHHRAMLQWHKGRLAEALSLMQRAVEADPANPGYRVDLAELYHATGSYARSTRLLLDVFVEDPASAMDCLFGLMMNQMALHHHAQALDLFKTYMGRLFRDVQPQWQLPGVSMEILTADKAPGSRPRARAERLADLGVLAMTREEYGRAERLLQKSVQLDDERQESRAMLAATNYLVGRADRALALCEEAIAKKPSLRAACLIAHLLQALEREDEARELLRAHLEDPYGADGAVFLAALGEAGAHEEILAYARRALRDAPYDRELLHAAAVAMLHLGYPAEQAARLWSRILRVDSEDSVARYYADLCRSGAPEAQEIPYAYRLPGEEMLRRSERLADALEDHTAEELEARWREDSAFRELIQWAVSTDVEVLKRVAVTVLSSLDDPEAASRMRSALFTNALEASLQLSASLALSKRGRSLRKVLPDELNIWHLEPQEERRLLEQAVVNDRALVHYAAELADCSDAERALLIGAWLKYREACPGRFDALTRPDCGALVLLKSAIRRKGKKALLEKLARQLHCSPRRLKYYDRRMTSVMKRWMDAT